MGIVSASIDSDRPWGRLNPVFRRIWPAFPAIRSYSSVLLTSALRGIRFYRGRGPGFGHYTFLTSIPHAKRARPVAPVNKLGTNWIRIVQTESPFKPHLDLNLEPRLKPRNERLRDRTGKPTAPIRRRCRKEETRFPGDSGRGLGGKGPTRGTRGSPKKSDDLSQKQTGGTNANNFHSDQVQLGKECTEQAIFRSAFYSIL
jgi:hypothetical protein